MCIVGGLNLQQAWMDVLGKPSLLLFNSMCDDWSVGTETVPSWKWNQFLDAAWEKAPLTAISPMETCCAQIRMFALNIRGRGSHIRHTLPVSAHHENAPENFYNRAER